MQFWQAQERAKQHTFLLICTFVILTLFVAAGSEWALRFFSQGEYNPQYPYFGLFFLAVTFIVAAFQYFSFSLYGGRAVAEAVGGRQVLPTTDDFKEQQLLNIVQEISIASSVPMPEVFILECEQINAFAAGLSTDKAAVAITRGALNTLTRDEIQGVIAHEFGHLHNADTRLTTRIAALVMGFYIILWIGLRLVESSFYTRGSSRKSNQGQVIILAGLIFIVAGLVTWFVGSILKCFISREREYLADASAVQFTRNPQGLIGALKKIQSSVERDMPRSGLAYSHMYFEDKSLFGSLFSTHPSIEKRIAALEK